MDQNSQDKPIANSDNNSITELNVEVLSPEKVIYKGPAVAISAVNNKGKFDVLFQHAQFISIINGDLIIHFNNKPEKKFSDIHGVLKCFKNEVKIYLGI